LTKNPNTIALLNSNCTPLEYKNLTFRVEICRQNGVFELDFCAVTPVGRHFEVMIAQESISSFFAVKSFLEFARRKKFQKLQGFSSVRDLYGM
jgi:hypothetical protein